VAGARSLTSPKPWTLKLWNPKTPKHPKTPKMSVLERKTSRINPEFLFITIQFADSKHPCSCLMLRYGHRRNPNIVQIQSKSSFRKSERFSLKSTTPCKLVQHHCPALSRWNLITMINTILSRPVYAVVIIYVACILLNDASLSGPTRLGGGNEFYSGLFNPL
jgi:hypothetical protein